MEGVGLEPTLCGFARIWLEGGGGDDLGGGFGQQVQVLEKATRRRAFHRRADRARLPPPLRFVVARF